jgi:hypothetical protein
MELNTEVSAFLDELRHPYRNEIEQLRTIVLNANKFLAENVKWNSPNYSLGQQDLITIRVMPIATKLQVILHRGAKKIEQPKEKLITTNSKLLVWKENDRAVVTFNSMDQIINNKTDFSNLICEWVKACIRK